MTIRCGFLTLINKSTDKLVEEGIIELINFFKKNPAQFEYEIDLCHLFHDILVEKLCRNKIIGRIFNETGLIEGWGTGIRRIKKQIEIKGLVSPEFKENNGFFKTIFYNEPLQEHFNFDKDENEIITYIQKQGKASTKELEKVIHEFRQFSFIWQVKLDKLEVIHTSIQIFNPHMIN